MADDRCVVVVPLYTTDLSSDDQVSLRRTVRVLGRHPMAIVCPEGLDLAPLAPLLQGVSPLVERFDAAFFAGVEGYNRLMLSPAFYGRFLAFDYVLVCQTDAYVFADRLDEWATRGYDYIGAPWIASPRNAWNVGLQSLTNLLRPVGKREEHYFRVGNGGFSLRRVATLRRITEEQQPYITQLLARRGSDNLHVEDKFFSLVAPELYPDMRIPDYREAVDFCIDRRPQLALKINGGQLPFACHGFNKRNVRRFWQPILAASENAPP
jgi:Protein of unknown function (DUF5672)